MKASFVHNQALGQLGEEKAMHFLEDHGFTIIARNFKAFQEELDIIALEGDIVVFVEVKTRSSDYSGHPSRAVDYKKRRNMKKAAHYFLEKMHLDKDFRYDIVTILPETIEHFENITF